MKSVTELGVGTHTFNTSTWKAVPGRSLLVQVWLVLNSKFQASQSFKVRSCLRKQTNKYKEGWGDGSEAECLPGMH